MPQETVGTTGNATLRKYEVLRKRKDIDALFESTDSLRETFLKVFFRFVPSPFKRSKGLPVVMFAVSRRQVKLAVDRNRIKRLLREAYRLEKKSFAIDLLQKLAAAGRATDAIQAVFIYQAARQGTLTLEAARRSMKKCFAKVLKTISPLAEEPEPRDAKPS